MTNRKEPEIRFPGFGEEWEQKKLGEVVAKQIKGKAQLEKLGRGKIEYLDTARLNGGSPLLTDGLKDVEERDILILWDGSKAGTVYSGFSGVLGSTLKAYRTSANNDFVYQFLKRNQEVIYDNYRTPNIPHVQKDFLDVFQINVPIPKEQNKIGVFFKKFDDTIVLHQQELSILKQTKQGFLQKMFPKEGEKVPELRFPGFTDDWEQRKLGDISEKIGSGKTPKGGNATYESEGVPLIRSQNIFNGRFNQNDVAYISKETDDDMKNSRVYTEDVLLNITGASIGRSAVYRQRTTANVNQHVCIIRPKKEYFSDFIQLNISSSKGQREIDLNQAGGGREGLNFQQISKISFFYPSFEEQKKIGTFFKQLDDNIALHQRELELLQATKKAFLQKMFV